MESVNILAAIDEADNASLIVPSNDFVVTQDPTSDGPDAFGLIEIESIDLNDVQRDKLLSRCINSPFHALH